MLLRTDPIDPSIPSRRWMVRVLERRVEFDAVESVTVTRLHWDASEATPFDLDLELLTVHGNLVPATAGATEVGFFRIGPPASPIDPPRAIERQGTGGSVTYLFSLPRTEPIDPEFEGDLVWRGPTPAAARPEIRLFEVVRVGAAWAPIEEWTWRRALLGVDSAQPSDKDFTLEDGTWQRVAAFRRIGDEFVHRDYASGGGTTVRFGDNEFGLQPASGTTFQVRYRVGNGARGNVTPDTLVSFDAAVLPFVDAVTNPLAGADGVDAESADEVRLRAPEAFRAITFRAVRPEDYADMAERLPWVQRAGAAFRWTGSWLTCFVTPDPCGAFRMTPPQRVELDQQLDRVRQAGREVYVRDPVYANLDLDIRVCVAPGFFIGDVKERVLDALVGTTAASRPRAFFSPDRFTFGTPLERSALEAAIQRVAGVRAVERILLRRRGWFGWRPFRTLVYPVGTDEIIRVENLPDFPERGSVRLDMEGGA